MDLTGDDSSVGEALGIVKAAYRSSNEGDPNISWVIGVDMYPVTVSGDAVAQEYTPDTRVGNFSGTLIFPISMVLATVTRWSVQVEVLSRTKAVGETLSISNFEADVNGYGPSSAAPEPTARAMMLAGFGAIGFGLRARGQAVRVTYA